MNYPVLGLLLLSLGMLPAAGWASPKQFVFGDTAGRDVVKFTSDAPLELITGQTSKLEGKVSYDNSFKFDAKHRFNAWFNVDLASIDTGIPLRNEHMKQGYLETEKYPTATFNIKQLTPSKTSAPTHTGETVSFNALGDFTLHGKTVQREIPVKVTWFPETETTRQRIKAGNLIRIQSTFPVNLEAYGIKRPEMVYQKLASTVYVTLDAFGTDNPDGLK